MPDNTKHALQSQKIAKFVSQYVKFLDLDGDYVEK
jgi:hypothetical protein